MALFLVRFDGEDYPVEADNMVAAIETWKRWGKAFEWPDEWDGTEEPEQVVLLSDRSAIRLGKEE